MFTANMRGTGELQDTMIHPMNNARFQDENGRQTTTRPSR